MKMVIVMLMLSEYTCLCLYTLGYKMEHIIALSLATTTFTEIGEEFTGAPSSMWVSCTAMWLNVRATYVLNDVILLNPVCSSSQV